MSKQVSVYLISFVCLVLSSIIAIHASHSDGPHTNIDPDERHRSCLNTDNRDDCLLLESINQERQSLVKECDKFIKVKSNQLKLVLSYNIIHFEPDPPAIRIPAICWLVRSLLPNDKDSSDELELGPEKPMDLVTWYVDNSKQTRSTPKRDGVSTENDNTFHHQDEDLIKQSLNNHQMEAANDDLNVASLSNDLDHHVADIIPLYRSANGQKFHPSYLSPFIIVPGLMGSRLEDKLNKTKTVHWICRKHSDWQEGFWLSVENFLPFVLDCWLDNMRLEYDPVTGFAKSPPGVQVRTAPFGEIDSVVSLDQDLTSVTVYMKPLIDKLVDLGYEANVNVLAAPYDFRLVPQQLAEPGGFYDKLTELIESSQDGVGYGNPVTLLCHSMGCTNTLVYLRQKSAEWKSRRIFKLIAISAPWGGTFVATKQLVSGGGYSIPLVSTEKLRDLTRTLPCMAFLQPQADVFGSTSVLPEESRRPFVKTPEREYGIHDVGRLLMDVNLTHQFEWFQKTVPLIKPYEPLEGVRIVCIHGTDVSTPRAIVYNAQDQFPNGDHETEYGDGDGTVNIESLSVCKQWSEQNPSRIQNIELFNTGHKAILHKENLADLLEKEVLGFVQSKLSGTYK